MFLGWLSIGGVEVINTERVLAYADTTPLQDCEPCAGLNNALDHAAYTTPVTDNAPWYRATEPDSANFYGLYPLAVQGVHDSTSRTTVTEFTHDGGFQSRVRHGTKQIRVRGVLVGLNREAVSAGMRWLRSVLDFVPCGRGEICPGREVQFFANCPGATTQAAADPLVLKQRRTMYQVEVLDGLRLVREYRLQGSWLAEVEFTLSAGVPWAFTDLVSAVTSTGLSGSSVNEVSCPPTSDAYNDLVLDPNDGALPRPPAPPNVLTVTMPADWVRYTAVIPASTVDRFGRLAPVITVTTQATALRMLRIRFYQDTNALPGLDVDECSWEGEFLVKYVPAWSTLTIDGIRQDAGLVIGGTWSRAASHLVLGSSGRPPTWPKMACDSAYLVVIDADTTLASGQVVVVKTAVGE